MTKELLRNETLASKLIKNWFWLYLFSFLIAPTGYIIKILVSNSVSVAEVWVLYSIISFITILSTYNWLWLTSSLKYFLPKYWYNKQYDYAKTAILISLWVQLATSLLIIAILFFGADWFALNYFKDPSSVQILKYFCIYFLGINIFQVIQSVIIAFQDGFNSKLIDFIKMWATVIFVWAFFLLWKQTILHYSISWVAGLIISVIAWLIIFKSNYSQTITKWELKFQKDMLKEYKKYSLRTFLSMNAGVLLWQIDQQMVLVMLWKESAGYYSNYLSILNIRNILIAPIMTILLPMISEIISKKENSKLNLLNNIFYNNFGIFALSLWVLMVVLWPEISTILFGNKFLFSWVLIQLGAGFIILNTLLWYNFNVLAGMSKVKTNTKIIAIATIVNIIANYIFIKFIWIYWAIAWTILWWSIMFIMTLLEIKKTHKVKINWKFSIKNTVLIWVITTWIYLFKWNFFILEDAYRYSNLIHLIIIWSIYYLIILWFNYKKIFILKNEINKLKG